MKFSIYQGSRQGPRTYNQDRLAYSYTRSAILMVLADGMGGHQHGELAAEIAVKTMVEAFQREATPFIRQPARFFRDTILQIHQVIENVRQHRGLPESPRTTIVVGLVQHNVLMTAHVGDSRLYLYRHGLIKYQTEDHSVVQSLLREGKIRPDEIATHPHRNKIYNCVGGDQLPDVALSDPMTIREGDVVMLCSDGVWSSVPEVDIARHLLAANIQDGVTHLLDSADAASKIRGDNMSVVGLQWGDRQKVPFAISTLNLPDDVTTIMVNPAQSLDLTDDEIERAINEIQQALGKTSQHIKKQES